MTYDLKSLNFGAIRRMLERLTVTPYGADVARALEPAPRLEDAHRRGEAVAAARRALEQHAVPRFGTVPEVRAALRQAEHPGAALTPQALANLRALLALGREMAALVDAHPGLLPERGGLAAAPGLIEVLERVVSAAGRLKDDASDTLRDLHTEVHGLRAEAQALVMTRARKPDVAAHAPEPERPRWHGARAVLALRADGAEAVKGVRRGTGAGGREVLLELLEAVAVDIGDHQSLHHHLSTFAGHVEVLKSVLGSADDATLVLLDELGTGTDPDEGAALAMAVLDELAERGVRGVVTTHLPRLKAFADAHPKLRNASMRFDDATLTPTYELVVGRPGRSLGLTIAERRGLPAETVSRARAYLAHKGSAHLT